MTKQMRKIKVTTKQIGGDDGYNWCVLIDGRIKYNGMGRSEALWKAKEEREAAGGVIVRKTGEMDNLDKMEMFFKHLDMIRKPRKSPFW